MMTTDTVVVYWTESLCFRGSKEGKLCFELNSQPVGLQRTGKNIVVGCMDDTLHWYTTKVRRLGLRNSHSVVIYHRGRNLHRYDSCH